MSLGKVCSFKFDVRKNKNWRDKSGTFFIGPKACPVAHMGGIYFTSKDLEVCWAFNNTRTRKWVDLFD